MTKELTKTEYISTMDGGMTDVTDIANPTVDIWNYVSYLVKENVVIDYVFTNNLVEKVYRNSTNSFDHILLPTNDKNIFVIVIVDLNKSSIYGHYGLDLNKEYGLT
jgi:hypothetical protein